MTRTAHISAGDAGRPESGRPRRGLLRTIRAWITAEDAAVPIEVAAPPSQEDEPLAAIGVFGKHPAWDDFLPDLIAPASAAGLDSSLRNLRRTLIEQGVAAVIEGGAVDGWADEDRLAGFDHSFVGRPSSDGASAFVCGRIHDSVDGRGRTRYPLVLAAHVSGEATGGLSFADASNARREWCFERGLAGLANLHARLTAAESKQAVIAQANEAAAGLSRALDAQLPATRPQPDETGEAALTALDDYLGVSSATGERAVLSVLFELNNRLAPFSAPSQHRTPTPERPEHLRLPAGSMVTAEAMRLWARLLLGELRRDVDVLLIAPNDPDTLYHENAGEDGENWIDLIVGPAAPASTLCLFGSPRRIPIATAVPFRLDPSFLLRTRGRLGRRPQTELTPFTDLPTATTRRDAQPSTQPSNTIFH